MCKLETVKPVTAHRVAVAEAADELHGHAERRRRPGMVSLEIDAVARSEKWREAGALARQLGVIPHALDGSPSVMLKIRFDGFRAFLLSWGGLKGFCWPA